MFGLSNYLIGGSLALALGCSVTAYLFFKQNDKLKKENELNKVQIENYSTKITQLNESFAKAQAEITRLNKLNNEITANSNQRKEELDKILRTHDLEKIADRKASLMERILNRASSKVMDTFQDLTNPNSVNTNVIDFGSSSLDKK